MRVFEFHFNPPKENEIVSGQAKLIFDSFCYEPENIYERRVGSLYMAGILKNVLPQNLRFLDNLAKVVKERYYTPTLHSPEKSLKESLQRANDFLERIAKSGNVSWLGNLSFAILSLAPHQKNGGEELNFAKVGDFKIFLLRGDRIIDIDRKVRFQEIEPYPLKIFGNIVSGKLAENDVILVQSREVFDYFQGQNLLNEIAKLSPFNERGLKEILNKKREDLAKISGICLVIFLSKETGTKLREGWKKRETILPPPKEFSLKEVFSPIVNYFKKLIKKPRLRLPSFGGQAKLKLPKVTIPKIAFPKLNKNLIVILALIFFLALGFFVAQREEKQQLKIYQNNLNQIQEKVNQAESLLILKGTNPKVLQDADSLLKESWKELFPLTKIASTLPQNLSSQISSLKNVISKNLYQLNNLVEISEPEILFEFTPHQKNGGGFVPQKMVSDGKNLYFFNPYSKNLFLLPARLASQGEAGGKKEGGKEIIEIEQKINLATRFDDSILFFSKPNQLIVYRGLTPVNLKEPYPDFSFDDFSAFRGNLYFLDKKAGQIIKYSYLGNFQWSEPELWLKKSIMGKSITINGSVWILERDNSISRYYGGELREKLKIDIFPEIKDFSKIFTLPNLPYLYILEPAQNRIIIINKTGEIIKQFQSKKFDNLLDFATSEDGKTIYLLNGLKVYQILITNY